MKLQNSVDAADFVNSFGVSKLEQANLSRIGSEDEMDADDCKYEAVGELATESRNPSVFAQ